MSSSDWRRVVPRESVSVLVCDMGEEVMIEFRISRSVFSPVLDCKSPDLETLLLLCEAELLFVADVGEL